MTGLKALIQNQQVRLALDSYVIGGAYGHILDSDTEVFYTKKWFPKSTKNLGLSDPPTPLFNTFS